MQIYLFRLSDLFSLGMELMLLVFIFFNTLKMPLHCLLVSMSSDKKSAAMLFLICFGSVFMFVTRFLQNSFCHILFFFWDSDYGYAKLLGIVSHLLDDLSIYFTLFLLLYFSLINFYWLIFTVTDFSAVSRLLMNLLKAFVIFLSLAFSLEYFL